MKFRRLRAVERRAFTRALRNTPYARDSNFFAISSPRHRARAHRYITNFCHLFRLPPSRFTQIEVSLVSMRAFFRPQDLHEERDRGHQEGDAVGCHYEHDQHRSRHDTAQRVRMGERRSLPATLSVEFVDAGAVHAAPTLRLLRGNYFIAESFFSLAFFVRQMN